MKSKKILTMLIVCLLIILNSTSAFASSDVYVIKGSGSGAETNKGSYYYTESQFDRRYSKVSATVVIPSSQHQILDGTDGKRAAYISFGVKGNDSIDFGLTKSTESSELNNWHVYAYNIDTGEFVRWTNFTYTGTQVMTLETSIGSDGQTDVKLTIGNDTFDADDKNLLSSSSFDEWRGLSDNAFYRFVSLVPVNSSNQNIYDGTMHRGVGFQNLSIYKENVDSNNYPYGSPINLSWGYNDTTIQNAFEVYPDQVGVHEGVNDSEYINIKHEIDPEV